MSVPCDQVDAGSAAGEAAAGDGIAAANIAEVAVNSSTMTENRRTEASFDILPPRGWELR